MKFLLIGMWQTVYLYALMALPQREMENRKGEMLALEREVDQLKVLFVSSVYYQLYY